MLNFNNLHINSKEILSSSKIKLEPCKLSEDPPIVEFYSVVKTWNKREIVREAEVPKDQILEIKKIIKMNNHLLLFVYLALI